MGPLFRSFAIASPAMTTMVKILVATSFLFFACGDDSGVPGNADAALQDANAASPDARKTGPDAQATALILASFTLTEGAEIPVIYTCDNADDSPPFTWSGGPTAASYAMVFRDVEPGAELIHSIIYDIPANVMALPVGLEKVAEPAIPAGSKQTLAFDGSTRGYRGPCPSTKHAYEFRLYALDVKPLPGVTLDSSRSVVEAAILDNMIATDTLGIVRTP